MLAERRKSMRNAISHVLLILCLGCVCATTAHAEIHGITSDIGGDGLKAIAGGLYAIAVGVAAAGIAIGIGLKVHKK
jgi:hypothetical protein